MQAESCLAWYPRWAESGPAAAAVILSGRALSYAELWHQAGEQSRRFGDAGLRPGQKIIIEATDERRWIVALLGALRSGAQAILPDADWNASRRRSALAALSPAFAFDGDEISAVASSPPITSASAGIWLFTSGTTAEPQPHFRSLSTLHAMVERLRGRWPRELSASRPRVYSMAPLAHGFGLMNALFLTHAMGGTLILDDGAGAKETVARIADLAPQVLLGWPAHYKSLADRSLWPEKNGLVWCISSSFRLEPEIAKQFADCAGCHPRSQYGMTETGPLCLDGASPPIVEPFCVGPPLSGIDMTVLDEHGAPVAPGIRGKICVHVPELTLSGPRGLWYTGDIGAKDGAGNVFVFARAADFSDERKELYS